MMKLSSNLTTGMDIKQAVNKGGVLRLFGRLCQIQNVVFAQLGALFTYVLSKKKRSIRSANHKQLFNCLL